MRFFSPPGEALVHGPLQQLLVHVHQLQPLVHELHEVHGVELLLAPMLPHGVDRRLQEVGVVHAGDLDRVLERHEEAFARALLGVELEQILALEEDLTACDLVFRMARQHPCEGALAGAVRAHDGVHLARVDGQADTLQDVLVLHPRAQVLDLEHDD